MEPNAMLVLLLPGALAQFGGGVFLGDSLYELKRGATIKDVGLGWMATIFLTALGLVLCSIAVAIGGGAVFSSTTQSAIVVTALAVTSYTLTVLGGIVGARSNKASR